MRMMGQDCRCDAPVYPDCFGCLVSMPSIPQTWQLDFPAAMEYASGVDSGSYSYSTTTITSTFPPWQRHRTVAIAGDYTFPDLSALGVPSILEIDDAPLTAQYGPYTQCIWASNEFLIYESGYGAAAPIGASDLDCPRTGAAAEAYLGSEYVGSNAWTYKAYGNTPPIFSYNRTRTALTPTDYRCGTYGITGCIPYSLWTCNMNLYGVFAILTVVQSGASYVLTVIVYWWPRIHYNNRTTYLDYNTSTMLSSATYIESSRNEWLSVLGLVPNHATALAAFPSATATANLSQGPMARYTKTVSCPGDFVGTPVTLTKVEEYKAHAGATQTKLAAAGIINVPSTVTITPV